MKHLEIRVDRIVDLASPRHAEHAVYLVIRTVDDEGNVLEEIALPRLYPDDCAMLRQEIEGKLT